MSFFANSSSLITKKAAVCSEQPIATKIGLEILKKGGNAADAAIATFVTVSLVAPSTSGLGGDIQCLFYRKSDCSIHQINGSGKTGLQTTLEDVKNAGIQHPSETQYSQEGLWVSIPGAVEGMFNVLKHCGSGKLSMAEILQPVIKLAEEGVIVAPKMSAVWKKSSTVFTKSRNRDDLLKNGRSPQAGEIMTAPKLAKILKDISSSGAEKFYCGSIAENIVSEVRNSSGSLTLDDFKEYHANPPSKTPTQPISIDFQGFTIWEMKPNTTGIVVLVALNVLKKFDLKSLGHNTAEYIHIVAEVIKISYTECWNYICDPDSTPEPFHNLLDDATANKLFEKIDTNRASKSDVSLEGGNTTYLAVVDEEGNGCSFIASICGSFGCGLIPDDCGFVLNNRLKCMSLERNSPNVYGPRKLPLHTIIPGMVTDSITGDLLAVFGVMGLWMQPQGHIQVLLNMIIFGMDPQTALSQPRFFVGDSKRFVADFKQSFSLVCLEDGINPSVVSVLERKGHKSKIVKDIDRLMFGKGSIIARPKLFSKELHGDAQDTWWSGVDPRSDSYPAGI